MAGKFNWGWRIALLYSSFVCFMIFLGYKASNIKVDLVTKNYYEEEMKYQDHINKVKLTDSLQQRPDWKVANDGVLLRFPGDGSKTDLEGKVYFYCPADETKDFTYPFKTLAGQDLTIQSGKLKKGNYRMEVEWTQGKTGYFTEGVIKID